MARERKADRKTETQHQPSTLERTASHEAGHAVAGYALSRPFRRVSIKPGKNNLGHCLFEPYGKSFDPELDLNSRIRERLEAGIICAYAGAAAEEALTGCHDPEESESDRQGAIDLAMYITVQEEELNAYPTWLSLRAKNMMCSPKWRPVVEALAKELLEHREFGSRRARQIIKRSLIAQVPSLKFETVEEADGVFHVRGVRPVGGDEAAGNQFVQG